MKTIWMVLLLAFTLALGACASSDTDSTTNPGDQPPGERKDGLGIIPGGAGFKQTF